jgi:hypothetical protein
MTEISPEHKLVNVIDEFTIFCAPIGKVPPTVAIEKGLAS